MISEKLGRKEWDGFALYNGYNFSAGRKQAEFDSQVLASRMSSITGVEDVPVLSSPSSLHFSFMRRVLSLTKIMILQLHLQTHQWHLRGSAENPSVSLLSHICAIILKLATGWNLCIGAAIGEALIMCPAPLANVWFRSLVACNADFFFICPAPNTIQLREREQARRSF
ncbi:hypothetical protein BD769DRAFT_1389602 [Suillus cothurnatus]|nr:hypothetical protein BD769DRAFT_1389602 [Suillus cothurnatus]